MGVLRASAASCPAPFDLTDDVVVVTGGSTGIGKGIAAALLRAGAAVAVWSRNARTSAVAADELNWAGERVRMIRCDVTSDAEVNSALKETIGAFGTLTACVANAATVGRPSSFVHTRREDWDRTLLDNLDATFVPVQACARQLVDQDRGGAVVLLSSLAGSRGQPLSHAYTASKGALASLTASLANDLGRFDVRVNAIAPGVVETEMARGLLAVPALRERALARIPLGRFAAPDDIAPLALFLVSRASAYVTGQVLVADGGLSCS